MRFDWDMSKSDRHQCERGVGFDFATLIFEGNTIKWPDDRKDYGELRVRAIGEADDLLLHVVFSDRGDVRRIISARAADRKERNQWNALR